MLPSLQPKPTDLESCAAACYASVPRLATAGMLDGKHCFCGTAAELAGAAAKALAVSRTECSGVPCEGKGSELECGGAETMLAFAYTCDTQWEKTAARPAKTAPWSLALCSTHS